MGNTTQKIDPAPTLPTMQWPEMPPRFQGKELEYLREALESNRLTYTRKDGLVERMLECAKERMGSRHAVACSSGTAAVHLAVAAAGVEPGQEVISPPLTDMGGLIGILRQNAVPTFADIDPMNGNVTAQSIEAAITPRTGAVVVVHFAGIPCEMGPIVELCKRRGLPLIEDCAHAYDSWLDGQHVGTFGDFGCFSLNDTKHLSTGEGGFVLMRDQALHDQCHLLADKYYDRLRQGVRLNALGFNFRMSELQGAVGLAQLERMEQFTAPRRRLCERLTQAIADLPGIQPPLAPARSKPGYWFYAFTYDQQILKAPKAELAQLLTEHGAPTSSKYLPKPWYHERVFAEHNFFPGGCWPGAQLNDQEYDYAGLHCPVTERWLDQVLRFPIHEGCTDQHVDGIATIMRHFVQTCLDE